jgi:hypothetical protein
MTKRRMEKMARGKIINAIKINVWKPKKKGKGDESRA